MIFYIRHISPQQRPQVHSKDLWKRRISESEYLAGAELFEKGGLGMTTSLTFLVTAHEGWLHCPWSRA